VNILVKRCIAIIAAAMAVTAVPAYAARVPWDQPCWDTKAYFLETFAAIANGNLSESQDITANHATELLTGTPFTELERVSMDSKGDAIVKIKVLSGSRYDGVSVKGLVCWLQEKAN
jgi:hypothetical protein